MDKKIALFLISLLLASVSFAESVTFWKGYVFIGGQPAANGTVLEAFVNNATLVANYTIGTIDTSVSDRYGYYMIPVVVATIDGGHNVSFRANGVFPYTGANGSSAALQSVNSFGPNLLNISINLTANGGACRAYTGVTNATYYNHSGCSGGYCVHSLCRSATTYCGDGYCDSGESSSSCSADCGAASTSTGGGGSGAAAVAAVEEKVTVDSVKSDTPTKFDVTKTSNLAVDEVEITTKTVATSVSVTVKESSKPADAPAPIEATVGSVYKYVDITLANVSTSILSSAKIKFKVTKSWITDNKIDKNTVKLNRLVGASWTSLATTLVSDGTTDIAYEADTPGFSTFVITGEKAAAATPAPAATVPAATATPAVTPAPPATVTPAKTPTPKPIELPKIDAFVTLFVLAVVILALGYFLTKKKKHRLQPYIFKPEHYHPGHPEHHNK